MLKLLLNFAGRAPLCPAHEVADGDVRWDFDEHMDVIARQGAIDDGDRAALALKGGKGKRLTYRRIDRLAA